MKIISTAIMLTLALSGLLLLFVLLPTIQLGSLAERALVTVTLLATLIAGTCFLVSHVTGNCSQVDKIWSLAPIVYVWVAAAYGGFSVRLVTMSVLVTLWGIRLTYNFWLKGGYSWRIWDGVEDYRWQILRQKQDFHPTWKWTVFNFAFISAYQNALILMMTLPAIVALQFSDQEWRILDYLASALMLFFTVFESVADWQQWRFQNEKQQRFGTGEQSGEANPGFLSRGLWSLSRHPNYFAEQAIWLSFYLFSVAASGQWLNWSMAGSLGLIVLFAGSSRFSEEISLAKYPRYRIYQKRVPRFLPVGRKLF
jgi:steroid 5-alpha reductase family enzyme